MTPEDRYWLAGFLEGEGCFSIERQKWLGQYRYFYPVVSVQSTDHDVIERAARLMGAKIYNAKKSNVNCKPCWQARVRTKDAVRLMEEIQDLMGERRKAKIAELLAL